jgi:cytoskeletal protein CcmA (bactofilin family)
MALWNQPAQEDNGEKPHMEHTPPIAPVTPSHAPREHTTKERRESVFGPGVAIEGKIEGDADLRIAGKFKGDIQVKGDVNIERGAHLSAKISAITIAGEVEGNVVASAQVKLLESGQLTGDLKATTLTVAAGSRMRGHVEFGWSEAQTAKFVNGRAHENAKNGTNQ